MKPGRESQTSVMVAMARAIAHGRTPVPAYSDPTALVLLPEEARRTVEQIRAGVQPTSAAERMRAAFVEARAQMMVARTVAIDDAIRGAGKPITSQLVILGAGLDGRAWRMPELRDAVVFEVDHPDTQREKRARAAALAPAAREIRFVPVDFTRDRLDDALAAAGHDPSRATTWVWEGVIMYLERGDIDATLDVIAHRSAGGSRLIVAYFRRALVLSLVGPIVRRAGEPIRSKHTPREMRRLLATHGFTVVSDENIPEIAARFSAEMAEQTRFMKHLRIVVADRR